MAGSHQDQCEHWTWPFLGDWFHPNAAESGPQPTGYAVGLAVLTACSGAGAPGVDISSVLPWQALAAKARTNASPLVFVEQTFDIFFAVMCNLIETVDSILDEGMRWDQALRCLQSPSKWIKYLFCSQLTFSASGGFFWGAWVPEEPPAGIREAQVPVTIGNLGAAVGKDSIQKS